tara:strand:- start:196 stop:477 length:282 start_codon:yes stop_codon:yes gene_type:complete
LKNTVLNILNKLNKFVDLHEELKRKNVRLESDVSQLKSTLSEAESKIKKLEDKLKLASISESFNGSEDEMKQARKKINEYVREIDKCIALLNK